ncbi:MAG: response regulator, partial [Sphingobacteriales bacterium]
FLIVAYYKRKAQREKVRAIKILEDEKDKELYKAKIDFFTNVTHEIRTPLTLMVAPLEKIEDSEDIAEIRENAKLVHRNTNRLISLTNQLLDFRKAEIEGFRLNFIKTDIVEVLREVYTSFRASAEKKNLNYTLSISREHVFSFVDAEAFRKMISNLIHNAVKYCDKEIQVKFVNHKDSFEIIVSNDGPLVAEHLKEKIFEPFYRAKSVSHIVGTGIGLALARSLAELHKGALTIYTGKALNVFTLTLPVHQEIEFDFAETTPEALPVDTDTDDQKSAILLIEDNREISDFLFKELSAGHTILRAPNGEKALDILNEHMVELVISDIMMPVMDGYELCRQIKTNVDLSHIPVLLLSAKNSIEAKIAGLNCGADVYVEKPFTLKYLTAQITSLLENRGRLKSHYAQSPVADLGEIAYSTADKVFLEKLNDIVLAHMANPEFEIDQLADMLHMSRRNMFRKIKGISGMAPLELINIIRLKKAAEMLLHNDVRVYEVADMVGFNSRGVFTRKFTRQFGMSPTEYAKQRPAVKPSIVGED